MSDNNLDKVTKMIYNRVEEYLYDNLGLNVFTKQGGRLASVIYIAYITTDKPITIMSDLIAKAYEFYDDESTLIAFQRSVYREFKNLYPNEKNINIVKLAYQTAKGIE